MDSSGLERKHKQALVASHKAAAEAKRSKRALQAQKKAAALVQLEAVARKLVLEDADILKMKVADITMQLRYLRSLKEDNEIPRPKDIKNKQDGLKALLAAMERWHIRHPEARVCDSSSAGACRW